MEPDLELHRSGAAAGNERSLRWFENHEVELDWSWHWDAFEELSYDRPTNMGVGYIPNASITAMADEWNLKGYPRYLFKYVMRRLDVRYIELRIEADKRSKGHAN